MKAKIAIIGIGRWGKNLLKEFALQADVTWCAYKGDLETKKFLEEFYPSVHTTTSYEDILNDPEVEAVVVATPTLTHFEIAKKVLQAGKHLFLEKPGCEKSSELDELCTYASEHNLVFAVGYEFVHHPVWQEIRKRIPPHTIRSVHTEWFKWGTFYNSAVTNLLCHDISLIQSTNDEKGELSISTTKVFSESDIVHGTLNQPSFISTFYINRTSLEKRKSVTVISDTETLIWNNDELFLVDNQKQVLTPIHTDTVSSIHCEVKNFLSALQNKESLLTDGFFALDVFKKLEQATLTI